MSERLNALVNMVDICEVVADIGTDHAYVPEMLIKKNKCNKVIATDLNYGPYLIAKGFIEAKGLSNLIEIKLGDGLKPIEINEVNVIIIAGMGGLLINKILEESASINKNVVFIFQPMSSSEKLREYLYSNGFNIIDEELVKEDYHFYEIIKAKKTEESKKNKKEIFYEVGEILFLKKHKLLKQFIDNKIRINSEIIKTLNESGNAIDRKIFLSNRNIEYLELMDEYDIK